MKDSRIHIYGQGPSLMGDEGDGRGSGKELPLLGAERVGMELACAHSVLLLMQPCKQTSQRNCPMFMVITSSVTCHFLFCHSPLSILATRGSQDSALLRFQKRVNPRASRDWETVDRCQDSGDSDTSSGVESGDDL